MKKRKHAFRGLLSHGNQTRNQVLMSHYDPNGSYTGVPVSDADDKRPVQDADDL